MLTPRQNDCWLFLAKYTAEHGYAPSFEEMADALNLASKSSIHRLLGALEERGFIRRLRHRSRAIEVLKMPKTPKEKN
jgi:repressor LexA